MCSFHCSHNSLILSGTKLVCYAQKPATQNADNQRQMRQFVGAKQLSKSPTNKPREDCLKPLFFAEAGKRKSSEILEFQSFALICYLLSRCVRDSNPWPHAWQACILTNWTNAPLFHSFVAISLDCGCKGRHFFDICNSYGELFSKRFVLYLLYILILRRLEKIREK